MERSVGFIVQLLEDGDLLIQEITDDEILMLLKEVSEGQVSTLSQECKLDLASHVIECRKNWLRPDAIEILASIRSARSLEVLRFSVSVENSNTIDIYILDALKQHGSSVSPHDFLPFLDLEKSPAVRDMAARLLAQSEFSVVCKEIVSAWYSEPRGDGTVHAVVPINMAFMLYKCSGGREYLDYIIKVTGDKESLEEREILLSMI